MTALERWRARTDGPLIVLAIGTLPFLLLEIKRDELPWSDRWLIDVVNVAVLIAFAVDYVVELTLASDRRAYARHDWTSLLIVVTPRSPCSQPSRPSACFVRYEGFVECALQRRSPGSWLSVVQPQLKAEPTFGATPRA